MSTLHQLALTRLPGVGPVLARKLLEHYGHAEAVFRESEKDLLALPGFGKRIARSFGPSVVFTALKEAEAELRSEEHTSELQSLMRNSYAVFCLKTNNSN